MKDTLQELRYQLNGLGLTVEIIDRLACEEIARTELVLHRHPGPIWLWGHRYFNEAASQHEWSITQYTRDNLKTQGILHFIGLIAWRGKEHSAHLEHGHEPYLCLQASQGPRGTLDLIPMLAQGGSGAASDKRVTRILPEAQASRAGSDASRSDGPTARLSIGHSPHPAWPDSHVSEGRNMSWPGHDPGTPGSLKLRPGAPDPLLSPGSVDRGNPGAASSPFAPIEVRTGRGTPEQRVIELRLPAEVPALNAEELTCIDHRIPDIPDDDLLLDETDDEASRPGWPPEEPAQESSSMVRSSGPESRREPETARLAMERQGGRLRARWTDEGLMALLRQAYRPEFQAGLQHLILGERRRDGHEELWLRGLGAPHEEVPAGQQILGLLFVEWGDKPVEAPLACQGQSWVRVDLHRDLDRGRFELRWSLLLAEERPERQEQGNAVLSRGRIHDEFEQEGTRIHVFRPVWAALNEWVLDYRDVEIGGYLLGRFIGDMGLDVYDACQTSIGSQQGVNIRPELEAAIHAYKDRNPGAMLQVVGWWHTHPTQGILMSDPDRQIHSDLFDLSSRNPRWRLSVSLVLAPHPNLDEVRCGVFLPHLRGNMRVVGDRMAQLVSPRRPGPASVDWAMDLVEPRSARPQGESVALEPLIRGVVPGLKLGPESPTSMAHPLSVAGPSAPLNTRRSGLRWSGALLFFILSLVVASLIIFWAIYNRYFSARAALDGPGSGMVIRNREQPPTNDRKKRGAPGHVRFRGQAGWLYGPLAVDSWGPARGPFQDRWMSAPARTAPKDQETA